MELKAGDRIDRYTLLEPIGEGGQGAVWRVLDPLDGGVERALKLVPTSTLPPEAAERARREARTLAAAPHPNMIACYGLFEDVSTGLIGLVLELVDGKPLHEVAEDPRMSVGHKHALLLQIAEALAHVHAMEIVHRDLKADNVVVSEQFWTSPRTPGSVKLVDFGIATQIGNPHPLTLTGNIVGTAPYLAPEAVLPSKNVSATAGYARDVYAFGVLAFELFTGKHPTGLGFDKGPGDFLAAYARIRKTTGEPWPPEGLPEAWKAPIASCLALDPPGRPPSGVELYELLLEVAEPAADESPRPPTQAAGVRVTSEPVIETAEEPPPPEKEMHPGKEAPPQEETHSPKPAQQAHEERPGAEPPPPVKPRLASGNVRAQRGRKLVPVILLALLLGVGGASFFIRSGEVRRGEPAAVSATPSATAAHSAARTLPASTACPVTCCGGYACTARPENSRGCAPEGGHCRACASDRACVPGACEGRIPDNGVWMLRLAGVTVNGKDMIPRPRVCMRHGGADAEAWVCHPGGAEKRGPRLRVTTAELTHEGIDLAVTPTDDTQAVGTYLHHPAIGVAALCRGLNFRFSSGNASYVVTLFLDDPEE